MLNRIHSYYYQCQMQLNVTGRSYCNFIVWSETGEFYGERILPDGDFISKQLQLAERFFYLAILPELLVFKRRLTFSFTVIILAKKQLSTNVKT